MPCSHTAPAQRLLRASPPTGRAPGGATSPPAPPATAQMPRGRLPVPCSPTLGCSLRCARAAARALKDGLRGCAAWAPHCVGHEQVLVHSPLGETSRPFPATLRCPRDSAQASMPWDQPCMGSSLPAPVGCSLVSPSPAETPIPPPATPHHPSLYHSPPRTATGWVQAGRNTPAGLEGGEGRIGENLHQNGTSAWLHCRGC